MVTGDLLKITLNENPTTGYVWRYENPFEMTSGVFSVEMDDYIREPTTLDGEDDEGPVKAGGKGLRTILLKAEKGGFEDFELILVRSWEFQNFVEKT